MDRFEVVKEINARFPGLAPCFDRYSGNYVVTKEDWQPEFQEVEVMYPANYKLYLDSDGEDEYYVLACPEFWED